MSPIVETLKNVALRPNSEVGIFINNITTWVLFVGLALFAVVLLNSLLEWAYCGVVSARARRASKSNEKCKLSDLVKGLPRWLFVRRRIRQLEGNKTAEPATLEGMAVIDAEAAATRLAIPRYLISVPVLLGLLGTLCGLSIATSKIQPLIKGIDDFKDLPALLTAMAGTLSGMKTAFSTSIVGIVGSILLSGAGTLASMASSSSLNYLDRVMAGPIAAVLSPTWEASAVKFSEALQKGASSMQDFAKSFESVVERFEMAAKRDVDASSAFEKATNKFGESVNHMGPFQQAGTDMAQAMRGVSTAVEQIRTSLGNMQTTSAAGLDRKQFAEALDNMKQSITVVVDQVKAIANGSPELYAQALATVRNESKKELVSVLDVVEGGLQQRLEGFGSAVQQLQHAFQQMHKTLADGSIRLGRENHRFSDVVPAGSEQQSTRPVGKLEVGR